MTFSTLGGALGGMGKREDIRDNKGRQKDINIDMVGQGQ